MPLVLGVHVVPSRARRLRHRALPRPPVATVRAPKCSRGGGPRSILRLGVAHARPKPVAPGRPLRHLAVAAASDEGTRLWRKPHGFRRRPQHERLASPARPNGARRTPQPPSRDPLRRHPRHRARRPRHRRRDRRVGARSRPRCRPPIDDLPSPPRRARRQRRADRPAGLGGLDRLRPPRGQRGCHRRRPRARVRGPVAMLARLGADLRPHLLERRRRSSAWRLRRFRRGVGARRACSAR